MKENIYYYFQKNNTLFNSDVLTICYKANKEEIEKYNLTSENIVDFIKHNKLNYDNCVNKKNYISLIKKAFANESVLLRIQCECFLGIYGDSHCDCEQQRLECIKEISNNNGVLIYLPQEAQGWGLAYKFRELELQVSGKTQDGNNIGVKTRDEAQQIILGNKVFKDNRSYEIVATLLKYIGLSNNKIVLLSENINKANSLKKLGLNVINYSVYKKSISTDNLSEYLIKIYNNTHDYSNDIIDEVLSKISNRQYNERTLSTLVNIVNKIKTNKNYKLDAVLKDKIMKTYNDIICGEEKKYLIGEGNILKIQNNFCCRVNTSIFKVLRSIFNRNIFERISLERIYYFQNKSNSEIIKIRTSEILDVRDEKILFFIGQHHAESRRIDEENGLIEQNEISISKLNSYFENADYDYIKNVEMITTISEDDIPGVKIFIKRIPNIQNRVLDIFGPKEDIKKFIDQIMQYGDNVLLNYVTNVQYEDENFTNYNLRFADLKGIIEEELELFKLM